MIDNRIINRIKNKCRSFFKTLAILVGCLTFVVVVNPSPEFEQGVSGSYKGSELIESLSEKHAYLAQHIDKDDHLHTEESMFWLSTLFLAVIAFTIYLCSYETLRELKKFDSPPPIIPDDADLPNVLTKYVLLFWAGLAGATSFIVTVIPPEYFFMKPPIKYDLLIHAPIIIGVIAMIILACLNSIVMMASKEQTKEDERLAAEESEKRAKEDYEKKKKDADEQLKKQDIATLTEKDHKLIFDVRSDIQVNQLVVSSNEVTIKYDEDEGGFSIPLSQRKWQTMFGRK